MNHAFFVSCHSPTDLWPCIPPSAVPSEAVGVVLDAMHAARPTRAQVSIWLKLCPGTKWPNRRFRRVAAAIGRRGLKTSGLLAWTLVYELLCVPHWEHAAPGSRVYYVVVAPRQGQAREAVRAIKSVLDSLAALGVKYEARDLANAPELVIPASSSCPVERVVTVMTADAVSVRGYAIAFAALDEAGFFDSAEWHAVTDRDIVRALTPGMAQFPDARLLLTSSPGAPQGIFHELVTKRPADTLVIRAPTWATNPRISEARCRELAGDDGTFEQEFAARRFGYSNENFIDSASVSACMHSPLAGLGPREGAFIVGLDVGQLRDATGIVVCSSFEREISPRTLPVRHVVVEHAELIASSKTAPTSITDIAQRVADLSGLFGGAPVVFDPFSAPTLKSELAKRGYREAVDEHELTQGSMVFAQRSMAPQHQTPRWRLLRDLVQGRRLHLGDDEPLAKEMAQLRATTMGSGALKVEGRHDNLADALALAAEVAIQLPPTGGDAGRVVWRDEGIGFDREWGLRRHGQWVRVDANGRETPAAWPRWDREYKAHLAAREPGVFTREEIEDLEARGVTGEDLMRFGRKILDQG